MKKYIIVLIILSVLLYSCGKIEESPVEVYNSDVIIETDEIIETIETVEDVTVVIETSEIDNDEDKDEDDYWKVIKVDKSKIVIHDEAIMPDWTDDWLPAVPPNSYDIIKRHLS